MYVTLLTFIFADHNSLILSTCIAVFKAFIYSGGEFRWKVVSFRGGVLGHEDVIGEVYCVELDRFQHQLCKA